MDIRKLEQAREAHEVPTVVEVINPETGDPILDDDGEPSWLAVIGEEANAVRAAMTKVSARLVAEGKMELEIDELLEVRREKAVAAVVDWGGWTIEGEEAKCTEDNVRRLMAFNWVMVQVERAMRARSVFTEAQSTS